MLGAPLKNPRWSWGAVRSDDKVVFLRVWKDEIEQYNGSQYVQILNNDKWKAKPNSRGYSDRVKHVKMIEQGSQCYLIKCEAVDKIKRRIKNFEKDEVFLGGRIKRNGNCLIELIRSVPTHQIMPTRLPEEVPATSTYSEGAVQKVQVNKYERCPKARATCIAHHGYTCVVCDFNFGQVYGPLAEKFIHVHHLKQLSKKGGKYEIDPVNDLRPVCPNCHAIIHLNGECRSIEGVRQMLQKVQRLSAIKQ